MNLSENPIEFNIVFYPGSGYFVEFSIRNSNITSAYVVPPSLIEEMIGAIFDCLDRGQHLYGARLDDGRDKKQVKKPKKGK